MNHPTELEKRKTLEWQDANLVKTIPCPFAEHEAQYGEHTAKLFTLGHLWEGIVECSETGESDVCEHENTVVEEIEVDDAGAPYGTHRTYMSTIVVCTDCNCTVQE